MNGLAEHRLRPCLAVMLVLALIARPGYVSAQHALRVVTTSADLKSLALAVGGARVSVESLTAPEEDPHAIELKPSQLARLRRAELLIRIGLDHEPWLAKVRLPDSVMVLDASRNVRLTQTETPRLRADRRAHLHAYGNTHYWLDPLNAESISAAIRDTLTRLSSRDAQLFEANAHAFADALGSRMAGWSAALAPFRGTKIVVMHDSWSYFAERFGLKIVAAAEPTPGVPPSAAELAALLANMREAHVRILVTEPHLNAALVRDIAAKSGAQAVTLTPSGYDYLHLLDENVAALAQVLKRVSR